MASLQILPPNTIHSPLAQNSRFRLKIQAINFTRKHIKVSGFATQYLLLVQTHHSHFTPSAQPAALYCTLLPVIAMHIVFLFLCMRAQRHLI